MPAKKRSRKQKKQSNPLQDVVSAILRPQIIGIALIIISFLTLLTLITNSRGLLTGAWIDALQSFVGAGVWTLPLVIGLLGIWMVILAIERMPDLSWQRPTGFGLLFISYIIGITLLLPQNTRASLALQGRSGGWLGLQLANGLEYGLSLWGAWAFVLFLIISGTLCLADRWLLTVSENLWQSWIVQQKERRRRAESPVFQPELPLLSGQIPRWKRLWRRIWQSTRNSSSLYEETEYPKNRVRTEPEQTDRIANDSESLSVTATRGNHKLKPHIVGGAQDWRVPRLPDMLSDWERQADNDALIREQGRLIQETLSLFGIPASFEGAFTGPAVTQYLVKPGYVEKEIKGETRRTKVKVSKIAALANDLALALEATTVRIEAPIPGTSYIGVEVPNQESNVVGLKELMDSPEFQKVTSGLGIALGENVKGQPLAANLAKMPHLLIAGATGAGKSVCINSIISCLLCMHTPDTLRFLMVDPKMVELSVYNGIPHLLGPVVTEVDKASGVLFWAVKEMERRYQLLSKAKARDLTRYNDFLQKRGEKALPYIVVIVDEMADLMMAVPEEVEKYICRLAQMARAVGMHLIIATQRPSVDVITGLIKANFPARIAFAVTSQIDSRVILDAPGAERLLGKGDMLYMAPDASKLERLQGTYLDDDEINNIVHYWKGIRLLEADEMADQEAAAWDEPERPAKEPPSVNSVSQAPSSASKTSAHSNVNATVNVPAPSTRQGRAKKISADQLAQAPIFQEIESLKIIDGRDELFNDAVRVVQEAGKGSVNLLQRKLRVGYTRASRLIDQLEEAAIIGPDRGGRHGRQLIRERAAPPQPEPLGFEEESSIDEYLDGRELPSAPRVWM